MLNNVTNLFQVLHHLILTAIQYAAEKLDNLFVIEVVHILNHSWEEKLHCQVQISTEFVCEDVKGEVNTEKTKKMSLPFEITF